MLSIKAIAILSPLASRPYRNAAQKAKIEDRAQTCALCPDSQVSSQIPTDTGIQLLFRCDLCKCALHTKIRTLTEECPAQKWT